MDSDFDLVSAIDSAAGAASNEYWRWDADTRKEYKSYARAQQERARAAPRSPVSVADLACVEEASSEGEGAGSGEEDAAAGVSEEREGAGADPPKSTPAEVKRRRWADYQQIARSELQEETGQRKVPLKDVNERARRYYKADGWMQE